MGSTLQKLVVVVVLVFCTQNGFGAFILETATQEPTGLPGTGTGFGHYPSTGIFQDLAASFHLDSPAQVTHIGGHMFSSHAQGIPVGGTAFGAIIRLADGEVLPPGQHISPADVVASTVFDMDFYPSQELRFELPVYLDPGDYALVFGSNALGAMNGSGGFPNVGQALPGTTISYYTSGNPQWYESQSQNIRMTVEGDIIPIPAPGAFGLLMAGVLTLTIMKRARQKDFFKKG